MDLNYKEKTTMTDNVLITLACGTNGPNRATRAFHLATVAQKEGKNVTLFLLDEAVYLAKEGLIKHVRAATGDIADLGASGSQMYSEWLIHATLSGSRVTEDGGGWYLKGSDIPIYFCPGNHDAYYEVYYPINFDNYRNEVSILYYSRTFTIDNHEIEIFSLNSGKDHGWPDFDFPPEGDGLDNCYDSEVDRCHRHGRRHGTRV